MVKDQSDVVFDEDRNSYILCLQSLKHKNLGEINQDEEMTAIDLFHLLQKEIHIEDIDLSGTGESMDHGCTCTMSGAGERKDNDCTEDARQTNPAGAGANLDLSLSGQTNGHKD
jgi:hypothetical protein